MTASLNPSVFTNPTLYLGLITIVMYAKDKFNMPTYDRNAMGPFAQLSPQLLTVDSRYRKGRMIYLVSMIFLYTALSIVEPTTLQSLELPLGFTAKSTEVFPVAAATFLISTAAAKDTGMIGRIELFIRQYAHKAAYIPTAVSDLAFSLRTFDINQWPVSDEYIDKNELRERQDAIKELAGEHALAKMIKNPEQEGELAAWIRVNILFFTLQAIFNKRKLLASSKLDDLTDLAENKENFERIQSDRAALAAKLPPSEGGTEDALETIYPELQRLMKNTSLTLAVLMSQAARSSTFLNIHLEQLGFRGGYLRDRSDHFVYTTLVYGFIGLAALVTVATLGLLTLPLYPQEVRGSIYLAVLVSAGTRTVSYAVLFGVLDYLRDKLLDSMDWHENLEGYLRVIIPCSIIGSVGCTVLIILAFTVFGLQGLLEGSVAIIQLIVFQLIIVGLGATFGVRYARRAARISSEELSVWSAAVIILPIVHGLCAALLIGGLNFGVNQYNLENEFPVNINGITARVAQLRKDQKEVSAIKPGKLGWFSGKEPEHIEQLLISVDTAVTIVNGYRSNPRGFPPDAVREAQIGAIAASCNELAKFVTRRDDKALFSNPERCELAVDVVPVDDGDRVFVDLVDRMSKLISALRRPTTFDRYDVLALIYSAAGAFLFAFMFGIGFTYWRAWWLNNERGEEDGQIEKLRNQVKQSFGDEIDFERWLITPAASVNHLTPIEAVRYEDYRGKLFSDVQKKEGEISRVLLKVRVQGAVPGVTVVTPPVKEVA